ncbi:MAG: LolA family protein, partial [Bacteroidales bacterium]
MKKHLLSLILVWSAMLLPAGAQTPAELQGEARKAAIDAILKANDIKTSLRFDFELRRHSALLTEDLVSSGQASYVYPDKVRWEVRRPQQNVFVLN